MGSKDIVIRDNEVYENCGEGIAVTRGVNVLVENNYVRDNHNVDIYVDNSHDVTVFQNEIVCDKWAVSPATNGNGISLGQEDYGSEWGKQLHDVSIVQNSITGCRIGIAGFSHIGNLINVNIEGNSIPSGTASQSRAISLLMPNATNVTIINNCVWWLSFTLPSSGVSLSGNYLCASGTNTPQSSSPTPSRTSTPSRTPSPVPSVTKTFTPTFITPSLSPTSTQVVCEKEYDFNHEVRVVTGNRTLRLRAEPNVNSVIVGLLFDTRDQVSGGQPIFIEKVIKDECTGDIWAEFGGYFALRYNGYYGYTDVDPLWFP